MTVLDREGLENVTCECYRTIRRSFERLLPLTYDDAPAAVPSERMS